MKDFLTSAARWFTDSRRAAVQALIVATLTLFVVVGAVSPDQSATLTELIASALLLIQGVIGLSLLRTSEFYTWFNTAGRAAVYGVAAALGPVGIAFQVWGSAESAQIITVATVGVSILTAFVQVLNTHTLNDVIGVDALELPESVRVAIAEAHARKSGTTIGIPGAPGVEIASVRGKYSDDVSDSIAGGPVLFDSHLR